MGRLDGARMPAFVAGTAVLAVLLLVLTSGGTTGGSGLTSAHSGVQLAGAAPGTHKLS